MLTSRSRSLALQSIHVHFDRGFSDRPAVFYERLNLRDWLNTLDWLYAEASDRLYELEGRDADANEIEVEKDILRMLEDEIREADRAYCRVALITNR